MPTYLRHCAQCQIHRLCVDHLQDHVLRVSEHRVAVLPLHARQEAVVCDIQQREPLLAELIPRGASWGQNQDHIVVGRVHAVEVPKVEVGVGVEQSLGLHLEAHVAVRGVLGGLAGVELSVAAEEDALQLAADGRAMAAAVVLYSRQHAVVLSIPKGRRGAVHTRSTLMKSRHAHHLWFVV